MSDEDLLSNLIDEFDDSGDEDYGLYDGQINQDDYEDDEKRSIDLFYEKIQEAIISKQLFNQENDSNTGNTSTESSWTSILVNSVRKLKRSSFNTSNRSQTEDNNNNDDEDDDLPSLSGLGTTLTLSKLPFLSLPSSVLMRPQFKALISLTITNSPQLNVVDHLDHLVSLKHLNLTNCAISSFPETAAPSSLETLNLDSNILKSSSLCLKNCAHSLEVLSLRNNYFNLIFPLVSRLKPCIKLKVLNIANSESIDTRLNNYKITAYPHWKPLLVRHLPSLENLDGLEITAKERSELEASYHEHYNMIPSSSGILSQLSARERGTKVKTLTGPLATATINQEIIHSKLVLASPWARSLTPDLEWQPRQIEYHPTDPDIMVIGSNIGNVRIIKTTNGQVLGKYVLGNDVLRGNNRKDVLALSWLPNDTTRSRFLMGTSSGVIRLVDYRLINKVAYEDEPVIYEFEDYNGSMTSLHVSCDSRTMLASGYTNNIALYDVVNGKPMGQVSNAHSEHINVCKFSNSNPNLFCSSSFDSSIKLWDLRTTLQAPVWEFNMGHPYVMCVWSPDDRYLLGSAVDNKLDLLDAKKADLPVRRFPTRSLGLDNNYTRTYFMNSGSHICTAATEESAVRIYEVATGKMTREFDVAEYYHSSSRPYIQSLRGDPYNNWKLSTIVAFSSWTTRRWSDILTFNLCQERDNITPFPG